MDSETFQKALSELQNDPQWAAIDATAKQEVLRKYEAKVAQNMLDKHLKKSKAKGKAKDEVHSDTDHQE
jgi:predicted Fe-S protein YdhL (DUF1289 family)